MRVIGILSNCSCFAQGWLFEGNSNSVAAIPVDIQSAMVWTRAARFTQLGREGLAASLQQKRGLRGS